MMGQEKMECMKKYKIYKVTNVTDNKSYIGFTSQSLYDRRRTHIRRMKEGYNSYFYNALRAYGISSFTWEILYDSNDLDFTKNIMESYFITTLRTHYSMGFGYNMTFGGEGKKGYNWSNASIKKMIGNKNGNGNKSKLGQKESEYTRRLKSKSHLGMKLNAESINKIRIALTGRPRKKLECPHCMKLGGDGMMQRWHFNNCKKRSVL